MNIEDIRVDGLVGTGPNGERPVAATEVDLTDDQITKLRGREHEVSMMFHHLTEGWSKLQQAGLEDRFGELGITTDGVYGSEFNADKQSDILKRLAETDVDAVVSIPVDTVATTDAYQSLVTADIDLVFMDNAPKGLTHGRDYAGCVSSDNKGVGLVAGRFLREFVGEGNVGMITFDTPFYVTEQREAGVREIVDETQDLRLVAEEGFTDPNRVYEITKSMLDANLELDGLFVSWCDPPAVQVAGTVENQCRNGAVITTTGLGSRRVAIIDQDGPIKTTGAQFHYQQGIIEVNMVGNALLGNETPPYIASGSLPVYKGDLTKQYEKYYQEDFPIISCFVRKNVISNQIHN